MTIFLHPSPDALWFSGVSVLLRGESLDVEHALYWLSLYPTHQTPCLENISPFLLADSVITPTNQIVQFWTSTSQLYVPELIPSEPRMHKRSSNLSGLSGSFCMLSLHLTLVRSSDRMRKGSAVLGSRVMGAVKEDTKVFYIHMAQKLWDHWFKYISYQRRSLSWTHFWCMDNSTSALYIFQ